MKNPFHIAIPVRDLEEARDFYGQKMGLEEGRSSDHWIDFNLFGHQFVTHLQSDHSGQSLTKSKVDDQAVPIPHFGVVLTMEQWQPFVEKVESFIDEFIIPPQVRFQGESSEQACMLFSDPSGNVLEFKAFKDIDGQLFKT